jgi:hypothetical protein
MKQHLLTTRQSIGNVLAVCTASLLAITSGAQTIGNHAAVYDQRGNLQPCTSWRDALKREVNWYLKCPVTNGYPNFVAMTFMRDDYNPRLDGFHPCHTERHGNHLLP